MGTGKIMTGIAFGAAIGSLLGALYAPDKGSKTRKKLSKKGAEYADELKGRFNEFLDGLKDDKEDLEETIVEVKKAIKSPMSSPKKTRKPVTKRDTAKKETPTSLAAASDVGVSFFAVSLFVTGFRVFFGELIGDLMAFFTSTIVSSKSSLSSFKPSKNSLKRPFNSSAYSAPFFESFLRVFDPLSGA